MHYNVEDSIVVDMFYDHGKNETTDFKISNITIRNLTMYGSKTEDGKKVSPGYFHCQSSAHCQEIRLAYISQHDSSEQFDCYNAYGSWDNVKPTPCLKKGVNLIV